MNKDILQIGGVLRERAEMRKAAHHKSSYFKLPEAHKRSDYLNDILWHARRDEVCPASRHLLTCPSPKRGQISSVSLNHLSHGHAISLYHRTNSSKRPLVFGTQTKTQKRESAAGAASLTSSDRPHQHWALKIFLDII